MCTTGLIMTYYIVNRNNGVVTHQYKKIRYAKKQISKMTIDYILLSGG